jgi:hypothetical protein
VRGSGLWSRNMHACIRAEDISRGIKPHQKQRNFVGARVGYCGVDQGVPTPPGRPKQPQNTRKWAEGGPHTGYFHHPAPGGAGRYSRRNLSGPSHTIMTKLKWQGRIVVDGKEKTSKASRPRAAGRWYGGRVVCRTRRRHLPSAPGSARTRCSRMFSHHAGHNRFRDQSRSHPSR